MGTLLDTEREAGEDEVVAADAAEVAAAGEDEALDRLDNREGRDAALIGEIELARGRLDRVADRRLRERQCREAIRILGQLNERIGNRHRHRD